jgi:hypothetical protein|tara:strand:+ start:168 stop:425 length:258 start_codon:yes stop_codon:yes gene_type:complete
MITWIKKILGVGPSVPAATKIVNKAIEKTVTKNGVGHAPKNPKKKPVPKVDFNSMKKNELLAYAKKNGIKANASMNKAALVKALK